MCSATSLPVYPVAPSTTSSYGRSVESMPSFVKKNDVLLMGSSGNVDDHMRIRKETFVEEVCSCFKLSQFQHPE